MLPLTILTAMFSGSDSAPLETNPHLLASEYLLTWDDKVDGSVENTQKRCVIRVKSVSGQVFGDFFGLSEDGKRKADLLGEVNRGRESTILTFRQIEKGYVCCYQVTLAGGVSMGSWRDTEGRSGDVLLQTAQNLLGNEAVRK